MISVGRVVSILTGNVSREIIAIVSNRGFATRVIMTTQDLLTCIDGHM